MEDILKKIKKLTEVNVGSEDDLILKVVIPFFSFLGYKKNQIELKYPISCYRPNKAGRKPEADCVFFSGSEHNVNTSLLVVEVKRQDQTQPDEQARFYSANLFVPFYVTWEDFKFEVFQLHSFQAPSDLGRYSLHDLTSANIHDLKTILSPEAISSFCETNEIKIFDLDKKKRETEALYVDHLQKDLRYFKILDEAKRLDILQVYVTPYIRELVSRAVPIEDVEREIQEGIHPGALEGRLRETRQSFPIDQALSNSSTIAIIGDPGAGKTTLLKHLCIQHCFSDSSRLPIFIAVRELVAMEETLLEAICRNISRHGFTDNPESIYEKALAEGRLLLCVDGLDEMDIQDPAHARKTLRKLAVELADITGRNSQNIVVISARRESWPTCRPEIPSNFQEYEIIPFTPSSIRAFVSKWFDIEGATLSKSLIDEFRLRGWPEFASNPLLLALTCIVYEKRGRLPDRLSVLYQRCMDVLLEEWDATRRISRRGIVHGLTPERKLDLLAEVAFSFHTKRRACFSRDEVLKELELHLPKVGLISSEAGSVFDEISAQHGLIRSWSIEGYYAFPHLVFQEYLAAKALRDRPEGFRELINHKDDPFWHTTLLIYAGMGDATELIRELLQSKDNILNSSLFLAAECLGTGAKLTEFDLRNQVIHRLKILTKSKIVFLKNRAIDAMASIDVQEAFDYLRIIIRTKAGKINTRSYATRYAIKIEGETVAEEIVKEIIGNDDYVYSDLIESLRWLPQQKAISLLKQVVASQDYPVDNNPKKDLGIRHRRRKAAFLLAKIGEDESIPILLYLLKLAHLENFVKAGIVDALASIKHPRIYFLLRDIIQSDDYPVDCKVEAARHLGTNDQYAKRYLLSLVADTAADCFDRRDAASVLCSFKLCDNDISLLEKLLVDLNPGFWGGPAFAAEAIANIGSSASLSSLRKAYSLWKRSDYHEKGAIIYRIRELLVFANKEFDVEKVLNRLLRSKYIHDTRYLPDLAVQYYHLKPDKANEMFLKKITEYKHKVVYGGTWTIIQILPKIPLTKSMISATLDLASRTPKDEKMWSILDSLWKRRDLDNEVREAFFVE